MRLLHTSDWHLGRGLLSVSMLEHQQAFLDWLVGLAEELEVDAVLIAGDIYDRAVPPVEAVAMLERALLRLSRLCDVVLVPGNHDSPARLGFAGPLLEAAHVHIRSTVADCSRPVLLGPSGAPELAVYGIAFLHPDVHYRELDTERSHRAVLSAALDRIRADLAHRPGMRAVVMAHAFVTGSTASDSERDISVGGVGDVPSSLFAGFEYVALGHLHRPQSIAGDGIIRYSGSPLAYSFSEAGQCKEVVFVEIPSEGDVTAIAIQAPAPRPLAVIRGDLDDLLVDPALTAHEDSWIRALVTDARRPADAMDRLRTRFPHAIDLAYEPHHEGIPVEAGGVALDPRVSDPVEVALAFVEYATGVPATEAETAVLVTAVDAVRAREIER